MTMKKRVLIVDDYSTNLYMLETILNGYGFEVISAENGKEALDKARLNPPELIVTDILMPVMDGYTLCREWKSDDRLKHIPLVFYTATYTEAKDEEFALNLGADLFVLKPQEPDILMNILQEVLQEEYAAKQVTANPLGEEMEFFRRHNEVLFGKLEKKMLDLETANKKLGISEERYRQSFENVSDIIYTLSKDSTVTSVSQSVKKILGYAPEDLVGRNVSDLANILAPESLEQAVADISKVLSGETISSSVYEFITKDGERKFGEISGSPRIRDGKVIGTTSVARDITDRKQAEEKLRESEERYRMIVERMTDIVWITDMNLWTTFVTPSIQTVLGFSPEERMLQPIEEQMTPDSLSYASNRLAEELAAEEGGEVDPGRTRNVELEYYHKDGSTRWMETFVAGIRDDQGVLTGLQGVFRDVTDRKQAEEDLKDTLESLRHAVGATIQVMVSTIEVRDPYTAGHQLRVADLVRAIATEMGLPQDTIEGIRMAGSIHDIGKLSIPAEILSKPGKLSDIEFSLIKGHARKGYEMLKDVESPWPLAEIVYQHHERMDGSGYPRNLKGNEIRMEARIMAVADVVEAMASHRPYRATLGIDAALDEIEKNRGILYDDTVVDACLSLFREKGFQFKGN